MKRNTWLMKTEPDMFSIQDLKRMKESPWDGVRNYQARNFMRDSMKVGDGVLFYHSSCDIPGVAGLAEVSKAGYPDFTAWDKNNVHFDPKSTAEKPVWYMVNVSFVEVFTTFVPLSNLRAEKSLSGMVLLRPGSRLSVQPVEENHFKTICKMGMSKKT